MEPAVSLERLVEPSRSTSIWIAPARASATTSCSSGSVPQLGFESDHSSGTWPNAIGKVPPPSPTALTWPPVAIEPRGERKRRVGSDEVEHERGAVAAELRSDVGRVKAVASSAAAAPASSARRRAC